MVTASLEPAQSANSAVRGALAATLVEASGRDPVHGGGSVTLDLAVIARMARNPVWRLECSE